MKVGDRVKIGSSQSCCGFTLSRGQICIITNINYDMIKLSSTGDHTWDIDWIDARVIKHLTPAEIARQVREAVDE